MTMTDDPGRKPVFFEGAKILYRNFSGAPGQFNEAGDRNFAVILDEETAKAMAADGWNIRHLKPRNEEDAPQPILKVNVKYHGRDGRPTRPPRVVLITSRGKTMLDESMLAILDWADIENVDMKINPYNYTAQGRSGISAYLSSIYVTIREDQLELKYIDVPDSAQSVIVTEPESTEAPF
jgi:hypothetical protein